MRIKISTTISKRVIYHNRLIRMIKVRQPKTHAPKTQKKR